MTDQQALEEATSRWGKEYPGRVFCCSHPTRMAGVIECPGDKHHGFFFTGHTWEDVFRAHDQAVQASLAWKVRACDPSGRPIERVVDHSELATLDWDKTRDWTIRVKRTPKKRRSRKVPSSNGDRGPDPSGPSESTSS
jgi:hypothetical protein